VYFLWDRLSAPSSQLSAGLCFISILAPLHQRLLATVGPLGKTFG
jgi:hypothetical protein